jgi:uncharacterized protein YndB with AHSA1/START domain
MPTTDTAVRREITVNATPERAFEVFAARIDTWWPRDYSVGESDLKRVVIEPREGGRFYEQGIDGVDTVWGEVLAYDPPSRLHLTWRLNGHWQVDEAASEIEVTFTPTAEGTTVSLVHSHLERLQYADALRQSIGGDGGWSSLLARYSDVLSDG